MAERPIIKTIGKDGKLHVVENPHVEEKRPSPAKMVADKLHVEYEDGGDNGNLTTREAGKIGGNLGGPMVRKLVYLARQAMAEQHVERLIQRKK